PRPSTIRILQAPLDQVTNCSRIFTPTWAEVSGCPARPGKQIRSRTCERGVFFCKPLQHVRAIGSERKFVQFAPRLCLRGNTGLKLYKFAARPFPAFDFLFVTEIEFAIQGN